MLCTLKGRNSMPMAVPAQTASLFDPQTIENFLRDRCAAGVKPVTLERYAHVLQDITAFLHNGCLETARSLRQWQEQLFRAGYALNTVNCMTSALNTYLVYIGYPDWCLPRLRATAKKERGQTEHEDSA